MSTLSQLAFQLKGWLPGMSELACLPFVREAYQDIRKSRKWSWLRKNGVLYTPTPVTSGTVSVTQFSNAVVADAVAAPLLNAIAFPAGAPALPITLQQFRVTGGPIYNITGWNYNTPSAGLGTLTLDRNYAESTASGSAFMVYMPYQPAPATDFDGWLSCVDYTSGYRFRRHNLYRTQSEVDRRDPYRLDFSWPIWLAALDYVTLSNLPYPRFEMWPGPTDQRGYVVEYWVRGDTIQDGDTLPVQITDQLIISKARWYGYQFLSMQENIKPSQLKMIDGQQKICLGTYNDLLQKAKNADNDIFDSTVQESESDLVLSGPLDADYLMGHDVFWIE